MQKNKHSSVPQITVTRPHRTVRYTRSQLTGIGALDASTIRHQLIKHFRFDPTKPINVRSDCDSRYYEQDMDEPIDKPMFG